MANIDAYVPKGFDIQGIVYREAKDVELEERLSDIPSGLDPDLLDMIKVAAETAKIGAAADIENIKSSTVADA